MAMVADLFARLGLKPDKKEWNSGTALIDGMKKAIGLLAAGAAISGIVGMITHVVELGGKLKDTSEQIGISAESLQELTFGASMAGISMEELTGGMKRLSHGLMDASKTGKGPVAEAFQTMGVSMSSLKDKLKGEGGIDDVLGIIADKFKVMPAGISKTSLAMDLFGRSGETLIPFLNKGSEGIEELRDKANELGGVMSNKAVDDLDDFGDSLDEVKFQFKGLKQSIVIELLPVLKEMLESFRAWVKENKEIIATTIANVVSALATAFGALAAVVGFCADVIGFFFEEAEVGEAVLVALGIIVGAFAIKMAAAWVVAFAPVVLFVAAIAAVVFAIRKLIQNWDQVKDAFIRAGVVAKGVLDTIDDRFKRFGNKIKDTFFGVGRSIKDFFVGIGTAIKNAWETVIEWIEDKIRRVQILAIDILEKLMKWGVLPKVLTDEQLNNVREGIKNRGKADEPGAPDVDAFGMPARPAVDSMGMPSGAPSVIGGDVSISITTGSGDPKEIASMVSDKVTEQMDNWLNQTAQVVG